MSKIDLNLHDNFDQIFIKVGEAFFPTFRKMGLTANGITLISYIPSFLTVYYLMKKEYHIASILFVFQYMMDCWDGHYARMFNHETDLGDKLDHYRDIVLAIIVAYYIINNWNFNMYQFAILAFIAISYLTHISCINKYYSLDKGNVDDVLKSMENICCANDKEGVVKLLQQTQSLGNGTFVMYIAYMIWNLKK